MLLMESQHCPVSPFRLKRTHVYCWVWLLNWKETLHILVSRWPSCLNLGHANFKHSIHSQFEFISPSTLGQLQTLFSPLAITKFISRVWRGTFVLWEYLMNGRENPPSTFFRWILKWDADKPIDEPSCWGRLTLTKNSDRSCHSRSTGFCHYFDFSERTGMYKRKMVTRSWHN